jgi:hypothetical protein
VVAAGHYNLVGFPLFERHSGIGPVRKARYDAALVKPRRMENKRMHDISPSICTHAINGDYLDIETNSFREIAVVGLYGHGGFTSLIRGESWTRQRSVMSWLSTTCSSRSTGRHLICRFFSPWSKSFLSTNLIIDYLCGLGRQLGYRGGLKAIEIQLGISRPSELQGMCGVDAARFWNRLRHSRDEKARERLPAYNEADCVNLQSLLDMFYCRMIQRHDVIGLGGCRIGSSS